MPELPEVETIKNDLEKIIEPNTKVDIVISHTCPSDFYLPYIGYGNSRLEDESRNVLSHLLHILKQRSSH